MNKAKLKSYAPQARKDFIAAVAARANSLGLSEMGGALDIAPSEKKGDVTLIAGQAWPAKVHDQRQRLIKRMKKDGFAQTVEAVAYTWFNRFAALRYMEIHDYLDHGYRVLSSREGGLPEIIAHATDVTSNLPGLNAAQIADMKLAGNQDGELYRLLLVAQCNALSKAMPFLFEHIDDESELLLPSNLERTDSVIAELVESIAEEDWSEVEVIGWLYQFYISEKKDAVIGKVVKSEDIPAATQLFTPNWIVQYLVQNSVGRLWLMANPRSTLKSQWKFYIEPAEQTPEVQAQLDALIQTRMAEDGGSLNPETITVLDPACGSGHILVEGYELLKAIYLERGYQARAIPRLILEKNLFGLDIDDRAAQMAGFALMMKARADDRRLLDSPIKLNLLSLQESKGLELDEFDSHLKPFGISRALLGSLIDTFTHAKTFGSLIQIPEALDAGLRALADGLGKASQSGDVFAQAAAQDLVPLVAQATVLSMKFDALVANPPYMGGKYLSPPLKPFVLRNYLGAKGDLYACFMFKAIELLRDGGRCGMITIPNWMFISSFEGVRHHLISKTGIESFVHNGRGVFGSDFGSCSMTFVKNLTPSFRAKYFRLFTREGSVNTNDEICRRFFEVNPYKISAKEFERIPGAPLAYWASSEALKTFRGVSLASVAELRAGITTGDNDRFVRYWHEVDYLRLALGKSSGLDVWSDSNLAWVPLKSGGEYRKWYGNNEKVLRYEKQAYLQLKETGNSCASEDCYFKPGLTWSDISGYSSFGVRKSDAGYVFTTVGHSLFADNKINELLGFLCSNVAAYLAGMINPTIHANPGDIARLPYIQSKDSECANTVERLIEIARNDWNCWERSWDFSADILVRKGQNTTSLCSTWASWKSSSKALLDEAKKLEEKNNRNFILTYELESSLSYDAPEDQIVLARADREEDCQRLISYAIGCMMGRYSLDETGLVYAHSGNNGFDATRYKTFPADTDGIVPITDELWFEDDATNRVREFLNTVWGEETLEENMDWLAESLSKKGAETSEETVRRYISGSFYKDHLQTYKKRPIYWHFSSGKHGAFQALVYLHRYHEGTLARMRAEYVVPLTGKMQSRIEMLEKDRDASTSTAARTKIAKQIESLKKKHVELLAYDEKLRHYADMRIQLDLDDGVKVNYGRFGDLLAEVKAVTGGAGEN